MPENFITQVRRPKGVLGERVAFVNRAAQASAAACITLPFNNVLNLSYVSNLLYVIRFQLQSCINYVWFDRPCMFNTLLNGNVIQAAALACAARFTNATRSPKTPFGRLTCVIKFSGIQ